MIRDLWESEILKGYLRSNNKVMKQNCYGVWGLGRSEERRVGKECW